MSLKLRMLTGLKIIAVPSVAKYSQEVETQTGISARTLPSIPPFIRTLEQHLFTLIIDFS